MYYVVYVIETDEGILLKSLPDISEEKGSLRELFKSKTSEEILREFREEDLKREKILEMT